MGNIACQLMAAGGVCREKLHRRIAANAKLNIQQDNKRFTCWISGGHQEDANRYLNGKKSYKSWLKPFFRCFLSAIMLKAQVRRRKSRQMTPQDKKITT